jgi:hypothetical protein
MRKHRKKINEIIEGLNKQQTETKHHKQRDKGIKGEN